MRYRNYRNRISIALILSLVVLTHLTGQEESFGLTEKLGEYLPEEISVLNEDSVEVDLMDMVNKPTLLVFVYYHCPSLCPKMLDGITELVNFSKALPGNEYQIFVVSIDHNESSQLSNSAKSHYTEKITKPITPYFLRFFTADSLSLMKLSESTGYEFRKEGDHFIHTSSSILISPEGMISQYFYGTYFNYMHFDMSLKKANIEEVIPTRLKKLKYCYNFQPERNKRVLFITKGFGLSLILLALAFFIYLIRSAKKK